jgi:hypothetical protein
MVNLLLSFFASFFKNYVVFKFRLALEVEIFLFLAKKKIDIFSCVFLFLNVFLVDIFVCSNFQIGDVRSKKKEKVMCTRVVVDVLHIFVWAREKNCAVKTL